MRARHATENILRGYTIERDCRPKFTKYALAIMPFGTHYVKNIRTALVRAADTISSRPSYRGRQRVSHALISSVWEALPRALNMLRVGEVLRAYNKLRVGISVRLEDLTS
jgi:hypothetical protein